VTTCLEKKVTLAGEIKIYPCELVSLRDRVGVLRYIIDREYDITGFRLLPGDTTIAVYWEDRPYTLYVWLRKRQGDRAYYFNIADSVSLRPDEFIWRDLAVDILVDPAGTISVLDEHELPDDLPRDLLVYIMKAKEQVLAHIRDIIEEADERIAASGTPMYADEQGS
jgi:hypothetical protein